MYSPILDRMLAESRLAEVAVAARKLEQRREWDQFRTVDKLERALSVARQRLSGVTPRFSQAR
ncbi:MAG: hypothetical protein ACM3S1_15440 [Hyphomicrobiales bacterium]